MTTDVKTEHRRFRPWRLTFKMGWHKSKHDNRITGRIHHLLLRNNRRWWDWGHSVMILVGTCRGGNYDAPSPPTWWYRLGPPKPMWRTKWPRHPLSTFQVVTDYEEFHRLTEGLNEDQMYEWQAICVDQDDELQLGHRYWGGNFYGLRKWDVALLRRYLRMCRRHDWFGLRSWLYGQALHAAVHQRKPFTCQATPPRNSGGYDHWHCTLRRRHDGMHRFNNYMWGEVGGEEIGHVVHVPEVPRDG